MLYRTPRGALGRHVTPAIRGRNALVAAQTAKNICQPVAKFPASRCEGFAEKSSEVSVALSQRGVHFFELFKFGEERERATRRRRDRLPQNIAVAQIVEQRAL